jgi:hypothetical protein
LGSILCKCIINMMFYVNSLSVYDDVFCMKSGFLYLFYLICYLMEQFWWSATFDV